MRPSDRVNRLVLVPREDGVAGRAEAAHARMRVRRFALARVGPARRSALGVDLHERLERVAGLGGQSSSSA